MKTAEIFINSKRIKHNGDPVLARGIGNVVMETDTNANVNPNKKKAANKIDPAVAFLMSFGTYLLEYGEVGINLSDENSKHYMSLKG